VAYFQPRKVTVNSPRITTPPPQIHHQKTTLYHPFFQKTPAKTPKSTHQKNWLKPKTKKPGTRAGLFVTHSIAT
jgi:hypothetical protein